MLDDSAHLRLNGPDVVGTFTGETEGNLRRIFGLHVAVPNSLGVNHHRRPVLNVSAARRQGVTGYL